MKKLYWVCFIFFINLSACVQNDASVDLIDDSMVMADDFGNEYKTMHYLRDKRGRDYFPLQVQATGQKQFVFDPQAYAWAAYDEEGQRVMTGSASGGKDFCEDVGKPCRTVAGSFNIYHKRGADCRSGEYPVETFGGAKMPYCMYFYQGYTIHAAFEVPAANTSHGCVRVLPSAAKWLNEEFITVGTQVTILPYADEETI